MTHDMRKRERLKPFYQINVKVQSFIGGIMQEFSSYVLDITEEGLSLSSPVELEPKTRLHLELPLPGQKDNFALSAEVCWIQAQDFRTYHAGVHFIFDNPDTVDVLQTHIKMIMITYYEGD